MSADDRPRTAPRDRLTAPVQRLDLAQMAAQLRAEPRGSVTGHRQMALVRHGPLAVVLFAFEKDGALKEHSADGEVVIQVLHGTLSVAVGEETFTLTAGTLLALTPGQRHSVLALERSDMLLSIARSPAASEENSAITDKT